MLFFDGRLLLFMTFYGLYEETDKPEGNVAKINDRGISVCRSPVVHTHTHIGV